MLKQLRAIRRLRKGHGYSGKKKGYCRTGRRCATAKARCRDVGPGVCSSGVEADGLMGQCSGQLNPGCARPHRWRGDLLTPMVASGCGCQSGEAEPSREMPIGLPALLQGLNYGAKGCETAYADRVYRKELEQAFRCGLAEGREVRSTDPGAG